MRNSPANDDEPHPLGILIGAIENYIDFVEAALKADGLHADRNRIRNQLFAPENRHMLMPDA